MPKKFFISGNTPSSKNNQVITNYGLIGSAATQKWRRLTATQFVALAIEFRAELQGLIPPYYIEFEFVRKSKHKFDYHNAVQAPADAMTKFGWLPDDNSDIMKPYFADYRVDKNNPGVYITVLKTKPEHYETDNIEVSASIPS